MSLKRSISIVEGRDPARIARASSKVRASKSSRSSKMGAKRVGANRLSPVGAVQDLKQARFDMATTVAVSTPQINLLTGVAEGNQFDQRDGRKVRGQSIVIRGYFRAPTAPTAGGTFRVMAVLDNASAASAPNLPQILRTGTALTDPVNTDSLSRFTILKDELYSVNPSSDAITPDIPFKWYIPLKGIGVSYLGTTAAQASAGCNHVYLIIIPDATRSILPNLSADFRFVDV